jgi:hypothetical protein
MRRRALFGFSYYLPLMVRLSWARFKKVFEEDIRQWYLPVIAFIGPFIRAVSNGFAGMADHLMTYMQDMLWGPALFIASVYLWIFLTSPYQLAKKQRRRIRKMHEKLLSYAVRRVSISYDPTDQDAVRTVDRPGINGLFEGREEIKSYTFAYKTSAVKTSLSLECIAKT